jgi:hypothetical protein
MILAFPENDFGVRFNEATRFQKIREKGVAWR